MLAANLRREFFHKQGGCKMKLKVIALSLIVMTFGMSSVALSASDYYPPERIHCSVDNVGKLKCDDFNRKYLIEDTYTADFPNGQEVLTFTSGVAYFTQQDEWQIFYTYKDSDGKNVKLKSISYSIKPDTQNGAWKKFKEDFYNCTAGYMSCPITNLPA